MTKANWIKSRKFLRRRMAAELEQAKANRTVSGRPTSFFRTTIAATEGTPDKRIKKEIKQPESKRNLNRQQTSTSILMRRKLTVRNQRAGQIHEITVAENTAVSALTKMTELFSQRLNRRYLWSPLLARGVKGRRESFESSA